MVEMFSNIYGNNFGVCFQIQYYGASSETDFTVRYIAQSGIKYLDNKCHEKFVNRL